MKNATTPFIIFCLFGILIPILNHFGLVADNTLNLWGRYFCFAIAALGVDLIWGYTGILSLCQAFFFCLAAGSPCRRSPAQRDSQQESQAIASRRRRGPAKKLLIGLLSARRGAARWGDAGSSRQASRMLCTSVAVLSRRRGGVTTNASHA